MRVGGKKDIVGGSMVGFVNDMVSLFFFFFFFWTCQFLFMSLLIRMEAVGLQRTPTIQEGEAITNSNSWI